ncbi:helix-turn-helix domain-containing protein [Tepidibacillus marianensis]|uniref:helix-turn-helix domain-containing protein n=1 Tax=Tepidibacillus marianensis TaxID=3131995 RepID=UPI0030D3647D
MVRTTERSLDILLSFLEAKELSLTEIAKHVSLHKSTVYRLVQTLEKKASYSSQWKPKNIV